MVAAFHHSLIGAKNMAKKKTGTQIVPPSPASKVVKARKKAATPAKPEPKPEPTAVDDNAGVERWMEMHQNGGFTAKYTGDESEKITEKIFQLYEDGVGIPSIAKEIGLSAPSVKSRMLGVLLKEVYETYYVEED